MFRKKKRSLIFTAVFILIIMILPLNITSIFIMNTVLDNTRTSLISSISLNIETFIKDLDDKMEASDHYLYSTSISENFRQYYNHSINQVDDWTFIVQRYKVYNELFASLSLVDAADGIYFINPYNDDFLYVDINGTDIYSPTYTQKMLQSIEFTDSKWHLYSSDEYTCMIRNVTYNGVSYGAIINCENNIPHFDYKNYELQFSSSRPEEKENYISCSVSSEKSDCILTFLWPQEELSGSIAHWMYFVLLVIVIFLLIIPILYSVFHKHVSLPLNELNHAHNELLIGNEAYRITANANTQEFDEAYLAFNNMAKTLQELRLEKINRELGYKQMQLNNLQLQIRPHFLLNMMNLLYTLIQNRETESAQEMVLYLSQYFRYMFRNGKDLNLFAKELDLIQNYLRVSSFQHPNAFTVSYQIDPIIELLRIPPLLIHNFVENIIHHALVPDRIVHIVLYGEYDECMVTLQISDDGRGMTEEDVEMINTCSFPEGNIGKHIGIRNSITRLQYYFGGQAKVAVESTLNMGTTFSIYIPYNLEEVNDDTLNR